MLRYVLVGVGIEWMESYLNSIINVKPNKPESIINSLTPDHIHYVGNRAWWRKLKIKTDNGYIEKYKNPDFKVKGQNKVIEIHGDYWHEGENTEALIQAYKEAGLECLVIWEHEIYDDLDRVLSKIAEFIEQEQWQMQLPI